MAGQSTPDLRDVLSEEGAGAANAGRRRRRNWLMRRLPWWVTVTFDRMSVGFLVALMLVGLVTVALVGVRYFFVDDGRDADAMVLEADSSVDYEVEPDPRFGQDIAPLRKLRWQRFGVPLHIGPRGVPLIEVDGGDDVREMTEMEMDFPHDVEYVRHPYHRWVVLAPGHTGYGVRWWLPETYEDLPEAEPLDRVSWFVRHEERLESVVADVSLALTHVSGTPVGAWDRRWGEALVAATEALNEEYANGDSRYWILLGSLSRCDESLEFVYRSGVTEGCPSESYQETVGVIWRDMGRAVEVMERLGRSAMLREEPTYGHLFRDTDVMEYQAKQLGLLGKVLDEIRVSFDRLKEYGEAEGYYVQVNLP